jgi:hypothetical protein
VEIDLFLLFFKLYHFILNEVGVESFSIHLLVMCVVGAADYGIYSVPRLFLCLGMGYIALCPVDSKIAKDIVSVSNTTVASGFQVCVDFEIRCSCNNAISSPPKRGILERVIG